MKYKSSLNRFQNRNKKSFAATSSLEKFNSDKDAGNTQLGASFKNQRVFFSREQRNLHTHIIGSTRTGKSKCLEYLIRQDIKSGNCGLCLIDPHGELYDNVAAYIAQYPRLADKVILFHPDSRSDMILGFNPAPSTDNISYVVELLTFACLKAWGQENTNETPRITRWLYNIFYVIVVNKLSIVEALPFLNAYSKDAKKFREKLLTAVQDQMIVDAWEAFNKNSPARREELMEGVNNRLVAFLKHEAIRNMIGQLDSAIDFADCMEQGKVVLINLHHKNHSFGAEQANLIGAMIVNEIYRSAFARDTKNKAKQKPFYVYIDEFGKFVTRSIAESLEELGKFKISFILAHQHLSQLKEEDEYIYNSIMTNCKNKIVFGGLSVDDAKLMADEINTGHYDQYRLKHQHETRSFEPVETLVPVTIRKKTQSSGNEQAVSRTSSDKLSSSVESGFTQTELNGTSQTDTETENTSYQIANVLRNSETETDMQSAAEQISDILANAESKTTSDSESRQSGEVQRHSESRSDIKNTAKQIVDSLINSKAQTDTKSKANQLINIMSKSNMTSNIHNVAKQTAQICAQTDANSDIQASASHVNNILTDTETSADTRSDTRQNTDTDRTTKTDAQTNAHSNSRQISDVSRRSEGNSETDAYFESRQFTDGHRSTESNMKDWRSVNGKGSSSSNISSGDTTRHISGRNLNDSISNSIGNMWANIKDRAESGSSGKSSSRSSFQSEGRDHITGNMTSDSSSRSSSEAQSSEHSKSDISSRALSKSVAQAKARQEGKSQTDSKVHSLSNSRECPIIS